MIKAIIFDCFGVLIGRGFDETYRYAGGDSHKDHDFIEALLEQSNRGQISETKFKNQICNRLGITLQAYERAIQEAEQPNFELFEYIKKLRQQYKTAVLSNVNSGVIEQRIPEPWLEQCFDEVIISADVGYIKPDPEIYEHTAKKLGAKLNECIFIDDRVGYVEAAKNIGMQAILYQDFIQMKQELTKFISYKT